MVYIPKDWLINQNNMNKVHEILERFYSTDVITETSYVEEDLINDLTKLKEEIIIKKFNEGAFKF